MSQQKEKDRRKCFKAAERITVQPVSNGGNLFYLYYNKCQMNAVLKISAIML